MYSKIISLALVATLFGCATHQSANQQQSPEANLAALAEKRNKDFSGENGLWAALTAQGTQQQYRMQVESVNALQAATKGQQETALRQQEITKGQQDISPRFKATFDQIATESRAACEKKEYQQIYVRSACNSDDLTLEQLSSNKKIAPSEKAMFLSIHSEGKARGKRYSANFKSIGDPRGAEISARIDTTLSKTESNALALYDGSITWGQYNKRRKEVAQSFKDELNQIVRLK